MEQFDTVVVGGGQAGLALGYYLRQQEREFVILEAGDRVGESWRSRWDSLRLFTPARMDGLPGMRFPAPDGYFPTKDEMADYLEAYAARFSLPVRQNTRVARLTQSGERYALDVGAQRIMVDRVVVATGSFQRPNVPIFAAELSRSIAQVHSSAYRNPSQLPSGAVLVVGAGNSGAEIAVELASTGRRVILSGRDTGHVPGGLLGGYDPGRSPGRALVGGIAWPVVWWLVTRALTADTRLGRKVMGFRQGRTSSPLIRLEPSDILDAGVERVPRIEGVAGGKPRLADGRTLDVAAVIWATGFRPDFGWIKLPIFEKDGYPIHHRGVVAGRSGLYFLGLPFQHTLVSEMIAGVVYDARYVAEHIRTRAELRSRSRRGWHSRRGWARISGCGRACGR